MKIYVASSWKNRGTVRALADSLAEIGHDVYDFTDSRSRARWAASLGASSGYVEIPPETYARRFDPLAESYESYLRGLDRYAPAMELNRLAASSCDACVLVLPCGPDSHADWGVAVGSGKKTYVVGAPPAGERTPSHLWCNRFFRDVSEFVAAAQRGEL